MPRNPSCRARANPGRSSSVRPLARDRHDRPAPAVGDRDDAGRVDPHAEGVQARHLGSRHVQRSPSARQGTDQVSGGINPPRTVKLAVATVAKREVVGHGHRLMIARPGHCPRNSAVVRMFAGQLGERETRCWSPAACTRREAARRELLEFVGELSRRYDRKAIADAVQLPAFAIEEISTTWPTTNATNCSKPRSWQSWMTTCGAGSPATVATATTSTQTHRDRARYGQPTSPPCPRGRSGPRRAGDRRDTWRSLASRRHAWRPSTGRSSCPRRAPAARFEALMPWFP